MHEGAAFPEQLRGRSRSKGRHPAEDAAPRVVSRGRTPAGKRKLQRFVNDHLIPARALWGGVIEEQFAAILDYYFIELPHRSFLEPLLGDRALLRAFRRGEVGSAVCQPPAAAVAAASESPPPPSSSTVSLRGYLNARYKGISGGSRTRSVLLREARRALSAAGASSSRTLLWGLELIILNFICCGSVEQLLPITSEGVEEVVGVELASALLSRPVVREGGLEFAMESSYVRLLTHGLCAFYGATSDSDSTAHRLRVTPPDAMAHVVFACKQLNRGRSVTDAPAIVTGGAAGGVSPDESALSRVDVPLFIAFVQSLGS